MPRGGARPGAGRKPKLTLVPGGAPPRAKAKPAATGPSAEDRKLVSPPKHLPLAEKNVWRRLAPLAIENGTLKAQSVPGFEFLCELVILHKQLRKTIDKEGWQVEEPVFDKKGELSGHIRKRHALWPQLQSAALRREQLLRSYGLLAMAKPVAGAKEPEKPANGWAGLGGPRP